ncbi:MAG: class I tRNA ligase family protein, partial [Candidatus Diapherotrites archaeon]|nr:class I tRNA ligase family protein [Candidatus Diapherotrites archaeon]
ECQKCGSKNIIGEKDVCDCWVDSSVTPLVLSKWLDDRQWFEKTYPNYMRPQGTEIIRTWAFYTIFRCMTITGEQPFKDIVINGMVAGTDGKKMSKSRGNVIAPEELKKKYSSDAIRQWASNATLGEDYPISFKELDHSQKFLNKLWNASAFIDIALEGFDSLKIFECEYTAADKWILAKHNSLIKTVTEALDKYEFSKALQALRIFFWADFSAYYLEMVKSRIYDSEKYSESSKMTAQKILHDVLFDVLLMLSPFTPHMTEEIYQSMYVKKKNVKSIHVIDWPTVNEKFIHGYNLKQGELAKAIITAVRKKKSEKAISLNKEVSEVRVYIPENGELATMVNELEDDVRHTVKALSLSVAISEPNEHAEEIEGFEKVFVETVL